jgi:hypothetical protein
MTYSKTADHAVKLLLLTQFGRDKITRSALLEPPGRFNLFRYTETFMPHSRTTHLLVVPQMKVCTNLRAGLTTQPSGGYVNGVFYPDQSGVCSTSTVPPSTGGGYVNGVFYPDQSGVCGETSTPPTTGGGYVGGVFYPDKSGVCG